ncbi:restriction endonuclease subunit S [Streptomyces sp. NPDC048349]|uniref:restriction endonuclease subunit S n=1 Tax=Streptomyces sp. NPDC048349 TaxID=3155486 RepID=UPI00343CA34B
MTRTPVLLGDVCEVTPSPSSDLFSELTADGEGTPVVTPADISDTRRIDAQALRRLPGDSVGLERFRLRPGDLVLVRLGRVGRVGLVGEDARDWIYHASCIRIRPDEEQVDPVYLSSYLAHPPVVDELLSHVHVGTVPMLTAGSLKRLPLVLPPLHKQRLMAGALGEVSLQMDVHHRMLARLDALRQGMFARMLGDEFPSTATSRPAGPLLERRAPRTRRTNRMS